VNKILEILNSNIGDLYGVGPYGKKLLKEICAGERLIDLLLYLPKNYKKRIVASKFSDIKENETIIFECEILKTDFKSKINKIFVESFGQIIEIVYFRGNTEYISKLYKIGDKKILCGKIGRSEYSFNFQITHPDYVLPVSQASKISQIPSIETIYTLPKGLNNKMFCSYVEQIFAKLSNAKLEEWINDEILLKHHWLGFLESLKLLHCPSETNTKEELAKAKERIIFDEFLASQIVLKKLKLSYKSSESRQICGSGMYRDKILQNLNFELTDDQKDALNQIYEDQKSSSKMVRMVQGDVGSGKTIVALLAILNAVEFGFQAVLMVPTEILAQQHFESISNLLEKAGLDELKESLFLLCSTSKKKKDLFKKIESGEAKILIGTHALFQESVKFDQIGLIVIDEQHRFGVNHRQMLSDKDSKADLLFMSATPIPRSLSLVRYGYMDHSLIVQKPSNRLPVITSMIPSPQLDEIIDKIQAFLDRNERVYWICPLIEESLKMDYIAIEKRAQILQEKFGDSLAVIHGRMKDSEIDEIMKNFAGESNENDDKIDQTNKIQKKILLSTTLIEVGVNVPLATLIVIEDAQKFGLSQLHQLRGRVGRGEKQSFCILIYNIKNTTINGRARLNALKKSNDGFFIAEQDLKIRGSGEFAGRKQSGYDNYKIANIQENLDLLREAGIFASKILEIHKENENNEVKLPEPFKNLINIFNIGEIDQGGF
jgi:ATP-dependent DNA helicase RecG